LSRLSARSRKTGRCDYGSWTSTVSKAISQHYSVKSGDFAPNRKPFAGAGALDLLARIGEKFLVAIPNSDVFHARTAAGWLQVSAAHRTVAQTKEVRVAMSLVI
jgi:hypothetical protein